MRVEHCLGNVRLLDESVQGRACHNLVPVQSQRSHGQEVRLTTSRNNGSKSLSMCLLRRGAEDSPTDAEGSVLGSWTRMGMSWARLIV